MSSCCLAFGLERLVFAFLTQHGLIKTGWPEEIQKAFDNFESNGSDSKTPMPEIETPNQKVTPQVDAISRKDEDINTSKFRELLRTLLVESLNLEPTKEKWLNSRDTFNWDSLNHLKVISCIEERFEIVIPPESRSELMDEKSIVAFLESELSK